MLGQRSGSVAVLAAVVAAAFQLVSHEASPSAAGTLVPAVATPAISEGPEKELLAAFRNFTKGGEYQSPFSEDGACLASTQVKQPASFGNFDWVIATVPDPQHSHQKLEFDREVESVQVAADAAGFRFDRYWFPWRAPSSTASAETAAPKPAAKTGHEATSAGDLRRESRESFPGVLLFRRGGASQKTDDALAIFLVNEAPDSGIDPVQFESAVCLGRSLRGTNGIDASDQLRLIGPNFSGSLDSLAKLIAPGSPTAFRSAQIRSWTSDLYSQKAFVEALKTSVQIDFGTTRAPSIYSINHFVNHIRTQWHDDGSVILLVEEGTGLSAGISSALADDCKPTGSASGDPEPSCLTDRKIYSFRFPRNISNLRNATENDTHLPGFGSDAKKGVMPRVGLVLSLKEDQTASNDLPAFSTEQTPVSQESVLFSIGALLKANTVHYAGIVASDPLDMLFLSRYLRSACPNLRVFTLESDLLFEHGSDSSDYQGILAVTTSPLFPVAQLWSGSGRTLHAFPSSNFEAAYNAATAIFASLRNGTGPAPDFRDYRNPFVGDAGSPTYPPLWIMVAGRSGYEPVSVWQGSRKPEFEVLEPPGAARRMVPQYRPGWAYTLSALLCVCFAYCYVILWTSPCGRRNITLFSAKPAEPNPLPRAFYLFSIGGTLSALLSLWMYAPGKILTTYNLYLKPGQYMHILGGACLLIALGGGVSLAIESYTRQRRTGLARPAANPAKPPAFSPKQAHATAGTSLGVFIFCLLSFPDPSMQAQSSSVIAKLGLSFYLSCFLLGATLSAATVPLRDALAGIHAAARCISVDRDKPWFRVPYAWGTAVVAAITLVIVGWALLFVFRNGDPAEFLAACRAVDLTGGVSPLVPVSLLMASLVVLAFAQLRRIINYEDRCPGVPRLVNDSFCPKLQASVREIRRRTRIFSFHAPHIAAYLMLVIVGFEAGVGRSQQTFENASLEKLMLWLSIACGFVLVLVWIRVLLIWSAFSEFLQQLERHPLRQVFSLLPRGFVWSPVWQGGGKKRTHVAITRSLECVLALKNNSKTSPELLACIEKKLPTFEAQVKRLLEASALRKRNPGACYRKLEYELSKLAEAAARQLERNKWPHGGYELKAELSRQEETREALRVTAEIYKDQESDTICGELVAFRFLAFINYVLWQLDNLVGYVSAGFLLLAIALASYDFRSRTIIDWILAAMFVLISAGIVTVFAQADRDAILSRITGTEEGKLDRHFFTHLISYGAMPVLVLAATHFPTVGRFFFSWVKPALEAIH